MNLIAKRCFPKTQIITYRFHVKKLASEVIQEERIRLRGEIIEHENIAIEEARKNNKNANPKVFPNGDTLKQLLVRSRYLLFKPRYKWTQKQKKRAQILFETYPDLHQAYILAMKLNSIYEKSTIKSTAITRLKHCFREF